MLEVDRSKFKSKFGLLLAASYRKVLSPCASVSVSVSGTKLVST